MKNKKLIRTFFFLLIGISILILGCKEIDLSTKPSDHNKGLVISATIFPLYSIATQITGDIGTVKLIMPPGDSPHTFEARPSDLRTLTETDVVFAIGHELDHWIEDMVGNNAYNVTIVDENIALRAYNTSDEHDEQGEQGEHDEQGEHGEYDPHYWLSAKNGKIIADNITNTLTEIDPTNADYYLSNLMKFNESIDTTSQQMQELAAQIKTKPFIPLHEGWDYYANEFELNLIENFLPSGQHQSTPKHLVELTEMVEKFKITAIFSEVGMDVSSVKGFASDNNLKIGKLDPVGGSLEIRTFQELLLQNMEWIKEVLE